MRRVGTSPRNANVICHRSRGASRVDRPGSFSRLTDKVSTTTPRCVTASSGGSIAMNNRWVARAADPTRLNLATEPSPGTYRRNPATDPGPRNLATEPSHGPRPTEPSYGTQPRVHPLGSLTCQAVSECSRQPGSRPGSHRTAGEGVAVRRSAIPTAEAARP